MPLPLALEKVPRTIPARLSTGIFEVRSVLKDTKDVPENNAVFIAKAGRAMIRALSLQTAQTAEETRDVRPEDKTVLRPGTTVLMKRQIDPGESKLFRNWKGRLTVSKRLDVYTYLLASDLYPRRQFIAHRSNIRPVATPQIVEEKEGCASEVR